MSPVTASRDNNGKVVLQFNSWLIPVVLLLVTTGGSFVIGSLRAQTAQDLKVDEVARSVQELKSIPDKFVTQREYQAEVSSMRDDINRIDKNVEKLLDYQIKIYESRRVNPARP